MSTTCDVVCDRGRTGEAFEAREQISRRALRQLASRLAWDNGRGTAFLHVIVQGVHVRLKAFTIDDTLVVLFATGSGLDATVDSFARR